VKRRVDGIEITVVGIWTVEEYAGGRRRRMEHKGERELNFSPENILMILFPLLRSLFDNPRPYKC